MAERPRKPQAKASRHHSRYDEDLFAAKNQKRYVVFSLATETTFTDAEDCSCTGRVCQVDKYSIQIELKGTTRKVWISKAMIVGTEVLV